MKRTRRWIAGLMAAALMTAASVPCGFASSADTFFGEFRMDASAIDKPVRSISVDIYRRDEDGRFQLDTSGEYDCKLNRVTIDAGFFIQATEEGVWVSVDYLTDIDGDGVYELLEGGDEPVWDVMDTEGALAQLQPEETPPTLEVGQPYILSPELLVYRSQLAVRDRSASGDHALDDDLETIFWQEFPLCMIKLHRADPEDGQDHTQTYYLQIYNDVLIPFDVSPDDWYYDAVSFGLSQGYFAGADDGYFFPDDYLPRAQMAQVLWAMSGSLEADQTQLSFTDVSPDDWFHAAVAWCLQERLISGYTPETFDPMGLLSREQMTVILHNYARYLGATLRSNADLSRFSDGDSVSSWAVDSMEWAVTNGLISGSDGALRPQDMVTRAELAAALYSFTLNAGLHGGRIYY